MLTLQLDEASLESDLARFHRALDIKLHQGLDVISARVAAAARGQHTYQNRTGLLERSTQALEAEGSLVAGMLVGGVLADTDYAGYVEARLPFLAPAWARTERDADAILQASIEEAGAAAGWRR
jgi:hypothetical protein